MEKTIEWELFLGMVNGKPRPALDILRVRIPGGWLVAIGGETPIPIVDKKGEWLQEKPVAKSRTKKAAKPVEPIPDPVAPPSEREEQQVPAAVIAQREQTPATAQPEPVVDSTGIDDAAAPPLEQATPEIIEQVEPEEALPIAEPTENAELARPSEEAARPVADLPQPQVSNEPPESEPAARPVLVPVTLTDTSPYTPRVVVSSGFTPTPKTPQQRPATPPPPPIALLKRGEGVVFNVNDPGFQAEMRAAQARLAGQPATPMRRNPPLEPTPPKAPIPEPRPGRFELGSDTQATASLRLVNALRSTSAPAMPSVLVPKPVGSRMSPPPNVRLGTAAEPEHRETAQPASERAPKEQPAAPAQSLRPAIPLSIHEMQTDLEQPALRLAPAPPTAPAQPEDVLRPRRTLTDEARSYLKDLGKPKDSIPDPRDRKR